MAEAAELLSMISGEPTESPRAAERTELPTAELPISAQIEKDSELRAESVLGMVGGGDPNEDEDAEADVSDAASADPVAEDDGEWTDDVYQPAYAAGLSRSDLDAMKPAARTRLLLSLAKTLPVPGDDESKKKAEEPVPTGPRPEDYVALFAEDFDDETAKKLAPKFQKLLAPLFEKQAKAEQERAKESQETEKRAFIAAANSAFTTLDNAEQVYGKGDWQSLDRKHKEARGIAFDVAELVMAGARAKGRNLTPDEALRVGHAYVSSSQLKQLAREDVAAKLKQRTSARSIAPSHARSGKTRVLTGREAYNAEVRRILGEA